MKYKIIYEVKTPGKGYVVQSCHMKVRLPLNTRERMAEAEIHLSKSHSGAQVEIVSMDIVEYDKAQTQK